MLVVEKLVDGTGVDQQIAGGEGVADGKIIGVQTDFDQGIGQHFAK